jgi:GNAT superfamily N-acetyltransferase
VMHNLGHLGAPSAIVEDVAVAPALQGNGIGKAMMEFALGLCRQGLLQAGAVLERQPRTRPRIL